MNYMLILITLIATIMAIQSGRIGFLFQLIFSGITAYWFVDRINDGGIYLWSDDEFTPENIGALLQSKLLIQSIFILLVFGMIFYVILPYLLHLLIKYSSLKKTLQQEGKMTKRQKDLSVRLTSQVVFKLMKLKMPDRKGIKESNEALRKILLPLIFCN